MKNDSTAARTRISSSASHRRVQRSTTLNRKYVKKPGKVVSTESAAKRRTDDLKRRQALADKINRENIASLKAHKTLQKSASGAKAKQDSSSSVPITRISTASKAQSAQAQQTAKVQQASAQSQSAKQSAQSSSPWYSDATKPLASTIEKNLDPTPKVEKTTRVKDSAVKSALRSVASMKSSDTGTKSISAKHAFGAKKLLLAFGCAALVVGIIGYAISTNTPDISVRVAAMQTGIDAAYPTYIPRGYSLSGIVSEDKKITMTFNSGEDSFTLSEEKSSWDNETLEASYAKSNWGSNYISVREQGITIYISGSDAAWINGSILYKIDASSNNLTKKQIKSIATSL